MILPVLLALLVDVDGDGSPDPVEVNAGTLRVTVGGRTAETSLPPVDEPRVTVETAGRHRVLLVRGRRAGEHGEPSFAAEWSAGSLAPLWTGTLGAQDVDEEWTRELEIGPDGMLLYETREEVRRCDGTAARLFPRRYDFALGRFRPVSLSPRPPEGTPVVTSTRAAPAGLSESSVPTLFRFDAASMTADDGGTAEGLSAPRELDDGRRDTAWSEAQPGFGRGALFVARSETARGHVVALRVVAGDASSNRPRRFLIDAGARAFTAELAADARPQWIVLPAPVATDCVDVTLDDVYPGRSGRTAIAELVVLTDLDGAGSAPLAPLARAVADATPDAADAEHTLLAQGARGTQVLLDEARARKDEAQLLRLRRALARTGDPAAATEVAAGLAAARGREEAELFATGLASPAALAGVLRSEDASDAGRVAAAQVLARLPGGLQPLLEVAGRGPPAVRRQVMVALAARPASEAPALRQAAAERPDVWRALALMAARAGAPLAGEIAAAAAAQLPGAGYEKRYRLMQALGTLAAPQLGAAMAAERDPALRLVAVEALPSSAAAAFTAALADSDPGVREAAAARTTSVDATSERPLLERLGKDRWPGVRRAAADALATGCARRAAADGLLAAARRDADEGVRRAALAGLVRCKEPRAGRELLAIARDAKMSTSLRAYAATLLGALGDRARVPELVELLGEARADALASPDPVSADGPLRLAAAAAHALGKLGDARADDLLLDLAGDPTLPVLQAAGLSALAGRCTPRIQAVAERALGQDALVARAARLLLDRCEEK